jgi:hypothetical protein
MEIEPRILDREVRRLVAIHTDLSRLLERTRESQ